VRTSGTPPPPIKDAYLPKAVCRFLLVSLNIDAILAEVTIHQRRKKLEMTQGNGLSEAYTATLTRIKAQKGYKSVLGFKALMWVLHSERPLRAQELCHALGVEIGSADLELENIPALRIVLASCLGLITVEVPSSTVRLVHFTLQEYLSDDPTLFHSPHSAIAEVCLTYLNFGLVRDLSPTLYRAPTTTPLLEYASIYWWRHTRRKVTENIKILALRLLDRFDEHISIQLLYQYDRNAFLPQWFRPEILTGFTGLHGAAFFAIEEVVSAVLDMREWDVNAADCSGNTALTWAAMGGHDGVVRRLLEQKGINPDQADTKYGWTPLSRAAVNGREGIVKMLLERQDVNPSQPDTCCGRAPLSLAAEKGHEGIVKMLLERKGVNPDQPDTKYGRTPLSLAAENGHEGVVKMFLERMDVNPDQPDTEYGQTPLWWAADNGREGIVMMLLEREDVNPNQPDTEYGRTPLSWAAVSGHVGIVKMLLERKDVRLAIPDNVKQTLQSVALSEGHDEVARIPLEQDEVNCASTDPSSPTSLQPTALHPDESSVEIQFTPHDPNTDITDSSCQPGPISVVHSEQPRLLDRNDSTPISADIALSTQSPWWYRPLSTWPLKLCSRPNMTGAYLTSTQPTPLFAFDRRFIISSLTLLLALLLYSLSSSLLDISFHKDLPSVRG